MVTKELKVSYRPSYGKANIPYIRLGGKYLKKEGINVGDKIKITVEKLNKN